MKDVKRISKLKLELYHLDAVTNKERKVIEEALATDNELRLRYENIKKSDQELEHLFNLNKTPVLTVINNENISRNYKRRNVFIGIGVAAAILCLLIPSFFYIKGRDLNTGIANIIEDDNTNIEEIKIISEIVVDIIEDDVKRSNEIERIVNLPIEIKETENRNEETITNNMTGGVSIAVIPNTEQGVYIRGGAETPEQNTDISTEQANISIPPGITFIFDSMFANRQLTEISIPERIIFIGNNAFANNQIRNVVVPNNIISIGSNAFGNNPLIRITIGANVLIDDDAIPGNFSIVYNTGGMAEGTYTRNNTYSNEWSKQ